MSNTKIRSKELYLLIIIFIIAIIIRIYNDPAIPYHYDPGKNIVYSKAVLDTFPIFPQYNPYFNLGEYYEYQILFPYIIALLHKITRLPLVDLTAISIIIFGSLLVITVYFLSIEIFHSIDAGLISAGLIALSKIQLLSYMNYYPQITALTLLPLSFIFVIRYIDNDEKKYKKKYLLYSSILSVAIILSSYLAGMIYLSILILSLMIFSMIKKDYKYILNLSAIILTTIGLLSFYILPIIERHGIRQFITGIIDIIFTEKEFPFTNIPIDDMAILRIFRFIIIILIIMLIAFGIYLFDRKTSHKKDLINIDSKIKKIRKGKTKKSLKAKKGAIIDIRKDIKTKDKIKYGYILLFTFILIPLILIESYRFRPILWIDRYIEFLDIPLTILVGYSIYFILGRLKNLKILKKNYKLISILILILIFSFPLNEVIKHNYRFGYWDTKSDLIALNYIDLHIPSDTLFVTFPRVTRFWVSALGNVHVLGGESSQMLGKRFDGDIYSNTIINSPNVEEKMNLIRRFGIQYIYLSIRRDIPLLWNEEFNIDGIKAFDNNTYFQPIYKKEDYISGVYIIKVKENLTPKYNQPKLNKNVTILGYLISIIILTIMTIIALIENNLDNKKDKISY